MAQTLNRFTEEASAKSFYPLWEMVTGHQIHEPRSEPAFLWSWAEAQDLINRSIEETTTDTAERRVLLMGNPGLKYGRIKTNTTRTIQGAYQILMPGESARPHRHSPNALRLILEDGGDTYTFVNGKECLMRPGDILLTPANCWHGHRHCGTKRTVWFDALDSSLAALLNTGFFEPESKFREMPQTMPEGAYAFPGLTPVLPAGIPTQHSAQFVFPWERSLEALAAVPEREDGSSWVRLSNPNGGEMAMAPMDIYLSAIGRQPTRSHRTTANAVVVVAQGSGTSKIGDVELKWKKNDVFTLPQWQWASHYAKSDDAVLFHVTDRGVMAALSQLKDEYL